MPNEFYTTVKKEAQAEYEEKKSIFIGQAKPVKTESDAIDFIKSVKKKHANARHNVYAFLLGDGSIAGSTDDGEPSGSAGVPVLEVIRKSNICDVCVVVTRYFGGILLGTGGLIRAYTNAAKAAIYAAEIVTYTKYTELTLECSYSEYQKLLPIFTQYSVLIDDTLYSDNIKILYAVKNEFNDALNDKIREISAGRLCSSIKGSRYDVIKRK